MPPRDWTLRLRDMLAAISKVQRYIEGMTYEEFCEDEKTVDAVLRNFTIIGEAAGQVPEHIAEAHPQIPWRLMRDMRNVVVHQYFGVSLSILWETATHDLPPLVAQLERLLETE